MGVEHKVEGKGDGNLHPLRKSSSVRMSIKPQCTVTVWQCWRNEAQLAKHVKELLASLVVIIYRNSCNPCSQGFNMA